MRDVGFMHEHFDVEKYSDLSLLNAAVRRVTSTPQIRQPEGK
jgi:hypothetical protein